MAIASRSLSWLSFGQSYAAEGHSESAAYWALAELVKRAVSADPSGIAARTGRTLAAGDLSQRILTAVNGSAILQANASSTGYWVTDSMADGPSTGSRWAMLGRARDEWRAMIGLIREMFFAPEAQAGAYEWASVLLAHAMIGAVLTALLGLVLGTGRAAVVVALSYALLWEGGQIALAGADLADSLVDASAVAFGAALVAGAWAHRRGVLGAAMAGLAVMLVAGVGRRGK